MTSKRIAILITAGLITAGAAFLTASGQGAQKAAAASMVVYKSAT
jgi:hypothetical protein